MSSGIESIDGAILHVLAQANDHVAESRIKKITYDLFRYEGWFDVTDVPAALVRLTEEGELEAYVNVDEMFYRLAPDEDD